MSFPVILRSPAQSNASATERHAVEPQQLSWLLLLCANFEAFVSRFLALVCHPKRFAPLIVDFLLLIQCTWSGKQLGLDLVYPMLGIRKRQSGRLARLVLEHSRDQPSYELRAATAFPQGIDRPAVAVMDLDELPEDVLGSRYSTPADTYGLTSMLILLEIMITLILHVFYAWNQESFVQRNYLLGVSLTLLMCLEAVLRGECTLKLARRSDTSTRGCAVFLDQEFAVILNGNQAIVEAISESSFNLCSNLILLPSLDGEERYRDLLYFTLETLCEGTCLTLMMLFLLLFRPSTPDTFFASFKIFVFITLFLPVLQVPVLNASWFRVFAGLFFRLIPIVWVSQWYLQVLQTSPILPLIWHFGVYIVYFFLRGLCSVGYKARNYPIQTAKFLDALGHPPVRKWQFDTLAAVATSQCLVLCHGISRPIRSIDVLAFLDILVLDERDVWGAWKQRVADRIIYEMDISFAPTIPTFPDERQQQLKDLLNQAQFGYDTYRRFYCQGAPAPLGRGTDEDGPSVFAFVLCTVIPRSFSFLLFNDRSLRLP